MELASVRQQLQSAQASLRDLDWAAKAMAQQQTFLLQGKRWWVVSFQNPPAQAFRYPQEPNRTIWAIPISPAETP